MADSDEDLGRSRRPGIEDQEWSSISRILGSRTIKSSDLSTPKSPFSMY
jgi:hypothetical protein